ncbi:TPA: hypothetical protein QHC16_000156 [Klebsiella michiganensis]|nr:hypothetical protein [Klebsiella michiganensis]HDT5948569.1 hypothetical protein [Klebsiella michiganensis]HDT5969474.1 hypothetical protein [Klebsiella michiganensis]HDT5979284.1 hypothetical protein [Klebsiella michiganensis]
MHRKGFNIEINSLAPGCQAGGNINVSAGISATKGNDWNSSSGIRQAKGREDLTGDNMNQGKASDVPVTDMLNFLRGGVGACFLS